MSDLPDGPFNTPPGTTWRQLDPPERKRDQDEDDQFWTEFWSEWPKPWNDDDV